MPTALEQVGRVQAEDKDRERERASRKNSFVCRNLVAKQPERLLRYSNCQRNCQAITNPEGKLSGVRRNFWGLLSSFPRFPRSSYLQPQPGAVVVYRRVCLYFSFLFLIFHITLRRLIGKLISTFRKGRLFIIYYFNINNAFVEIMTKSR